MKKTTGTRKITADGNLDYTKERGTPEMVTVRVDVKDLFFFFFWFLFLNISLKNN